MNEGRERDPAPYGEARPPGVSANPPDSDRPRLITVVSTEEEFDWSQPFQRHNSSVESARHLHRGQEVFDGCGVRPTYVVDYPIATQATSVEVLRDIHADRRCEIGAHLHPWVTPPDEEVVTVNNSFPGNLPPALERRKLETLCAAIEASFGSRPRTYQAGRYGFGPSTAATLESLGFEVDVSASPAFDYSSEGGPDYLGLDPRPFWFGRERSLLAVPLTGAVIGTIPVARAHVYRMAASRGLRWSRATAVLSRCRLLERLRLSPEGHDVHALKRLVQVLLDEGVRVFVFSMHSPTFMPGCTPYVTSERDLGIYLDQIRRFYDLFLGAMSGRHLTPSELRSELIDRCPPRR